MNDTELRATPLVSPAVSSAVRLSLGRFSPVRIFWAAAGGSGGTGTPPPAKGPESEGDLDVEERQKTARPRRYKVVFHNDDYTTMEFVVDVLRNFFHKSETEALHIMLTVHKKGSAVAGIYPRDVAETKVSEVTRYARDNGMPLLVTAEPE